MNDIDSLRTFVRVVELGSLSAAGRALGLSPPSVSRIIRSLEEEAGTRLLNRTSRKLALTQIGIAFHRQAGAVLAAYDGLKDVVANATREPRGILTVHSRISVGKYFLLGAIPKFLNAYPKIDLRLWLSEDVRDLVDNRIDVALCLGRPDETPFAMRQLSAGVKTLLFASPAYLRDHSPIEKADDLLVHSCLTGLREDGPDGGIGVWHIRENGVIRTLRVRGRLQASDGWMLRDAAIAGMGIGLLPGWMIHKELRHGRLVQVLPDLEITPLTFDQGLYAVFSKTPKVAPNTRVFVDFLVKIFKEQEATITKMDTGRAD